MQAPKPARCMNTYMHSKHSVCTYMYVDVYVCKCTTIYYMLYIHSCIYSVSGPRPSSACRAWGQARGRFRPDGSSGHPTRHRAKGSDSDICNPLLAWSSRIGLTRRSLTRSRAILHCLTTSTRLRKRQRSSGCWPPELTGSVLSNT